MLSTVHVSFTIAVCIISKFTAYLFIFNSPHVQMMKAKLLLRFLKYLL